MSQFLRTYLQRGLSDIVCIDHQWEEECGGWNNENISETVVARKGAIFVKVSSSAHIRIGYGNSTSDVGEPERITPLEYKRLAKGKAIMDTSEAHGQIADEDRRVGRRVELEARLGTLAPKCPDCGKKMVQRRSKHGPFWGCSAFRRCQGTVGLSTEASKVSAELYRT